ncbi:MAG: tRNA lysidine(34) synthetase TilS, partial [Plesiomonas shigelloides]
AGSIRLQPATRQRSRELKKLWQEYQVPTWLRPCIAVLFADDYPLAVAGLWVERAALAANEGYILTLECPSALVPGA